MNNKVFVNIRKKCKETGRKHKDLEGKFEKIEIKA
jgi:hypothetical protein